MDQMLRHEDFAPLVGKPFRFEGWHGTLHLDRIHHAPNAGEGQLRPPFTLIFRGPPQDILPEGLYTAAVDDGPSTRFYIMPVHTPARDRQEYQVVFN